MGERYAFGVDEPWKAWVAYAKAGWDTITRRAEDQRRTGTCAKFQLFFLWLVCFFSLRVMKNPVVHMVPHFKGLLYVYIYIYRGELSMYDI